MNLEEMAKDPDRFKKAKKRADQARSNRRKGASGEREAGKWLAKKLHLDYIPLRNLNQTRSGGEDLEIPPFFCIEVKRQEKLELNKWWEQVSKASETTGFEPVVMYRQNYEAWEFLIDAKCCGIDGFLNISEIEFIDWAKDVMRE